jgi:phosphate transport system protein
MRDFETELREVRMRAHEMGTRCETAVALAIEAMLRGPSEPAARVRDLEEQTDRDDVEITAHVLRILALRQPVARDLRFLTAVLKLVTDLERIGDESVLIAERAMEGHGEAASLVLDELEPMAKQAQEVLREALAGFFEEDIPKAERALEGDRAVNDQYRSIVATTSDRMTKRSEQAVTGMLVVRIARHLERIAGHAANVAEEAMFIVTGVDVRHPRSAAHSPS